MSASGQITRETLRSLVSSLAGAGDGQIARVVAMIDSLPERGAADALIAPLRGRLSHIVPVRRLNFTRLLFQPLDPAILPPAQWRPGSVAFPRSVLAPVAALVRAGLGPVAGAVDAALAASPAPAPHEVAAKGAMVWSRAAGILAAARPPADWQSASGLPVAQFAPLAARLSAVLRHADTMQALARRSAEGAPCSELPVRELLLAAAGDPLSWGTILVLLIARVGATATLMRLADEVAGQCGRARLDQEPALDFTLRSLDQLPARLARTELGDVGEIADEIERAAEVADGLRDALQHRPGLRQQMQQTRSALDAVCRSGFDRALGETLFRPLAGSVDDAEAARLENDARLIRRLETAGRRFGAGEHYDAMLRAGAARIASLDAPGLLPVDRLRLTEILLGTEAALPLLKAVAPTTR